MDAGDEDPLISYIRCGLRIRRLTWSGGENGEEIDQACGGQDED